jgi:hypothetical protein
MCEHTYETENLRHMRAKIEARKDDMQKYHPKVFAAMEPIIDDVLAWLDGAQSHMEHLHNRTKSLQAKSRRPLTVQLVESD